MFDEQSSGVSSMENEISCGGSTGPSSTTQESGRCSGRGSGFTERLRGMFGDEGDGDLLLQQSDREQSVLQWLQALDFQVSGACRADERLKPLLKLNASSGIAEDRLLAHLNQHFEASEVGMLARCLCIPLVSIRVGKVIKQVNLLCPTATRGNLNLTLLPTSDLRISFIGDDGCTERLATLRDNSESMAVVIEEIPADNSGRSFLIRLPGSQVLYFWCAEKSKLLGIELLAKMKDLLRKKPTLAQLTGISDSRLDCFATHLRAYLLGSNVSNTQANSSVSSPSSVDTASHPLECEQNNQCSSASSKPIRTRHNGGSAAKAHAPYQVCLSPRSNSFKDGIQRSQSLTRTGAKDKLRWRGDGHVLTNDNMPVASTSITEASSASQTENEKPHELGGSCPLLPLSFLESLGNSVSPPTSNLLSFRFPSSEISASSGSFFSPYYCWCPPCVSTLQNSVTSPQLPILPTESVSLPPLSSFSSVTRLPSSVASSKPSINLSDVPSLDFPAFVPDPVVRIPLPVSSFINVPSSQQVPTFTPLMCDPIVHIPVIDVCSSGQGYLVSAGPAISTTIPPLHPKLVNPLIPETESVVEKGARETLRLLISSTQTNPQLMNVLPAALTSADDKCTMLVAGSRGLYSGDVDVVAKGIAAVGLVPLPGRGNGAKRYGRDGDDTENRPGQTGSLEDSFDGKEGSL
ncbi:PREDICTED: uncharacterized protein LOC104596991 isoform X2 [Nelumbo nucifera]|nr:PREDICTED: uncharacterized protein LOC104596991 isoform X2 [Nelumbo nucifera]